jgi:RsiW-degrading membrane proteinase PrsW (M82 family)
MIHDPKTIILAFITGVLPALLWLWFWRREESQSGESNKALIGIFIVSMLSVIFTIPIQKFIQTHISDYNLELTLWALAEELIKYFAFFIIVYKTNYIKKPVDYAICLATAGLGFAALENVLFLLKPFAEGQAFVGLLTGGLRFLGSTLLHSITSGIIGISLGLSFYMNEFLKKYYLILGLIVATALHTVFNFFIINNKGSEFLKTFAFLWVVSIIIMLLFEKLRRMSGEIN